MGNIEDTKPIEALAGRTWSGTQWHYPYIEQMCKEMRELREAVKVLATVIVESRKQREYERINNLCPGGCVADSLEQAAVKVLANPIAAAAVREAGKQ